MSPRRNWDSPTPRQRVCPSPPAGEGLGESQFRRLEKNLALCLLCGLYTLLLRSIYLPFLPAIEETSPEIIKYITRNTVSNYHQFSKPNILPAGRFFATSFPFHQSQGLKDRGGQANFLKNFEKFANRKSTNLWVHSAIANPQILTCASPQIANLQISMANAQIHKFSQNTAQLCLKTVLKVFFLKRF